MTDALEPSPAAGAGRKLTAPITLTLHPRDDGGVSVSSTMEPGLILSGADAAGVVDAIIPAVEMLREHRGSATPPAGARSGVARKWELGPDLTPRESQPASPARATAPRPVQPEPALAYQRAEEAICECGAADSGEPHTEWCPWLTSQWYKWGEAFAATTPAPVQPEGWNDIASAPKDGTVVDLFISGKRVPDCKWTSIVPDEYGWDGAWVREPSGQYAVGEDEIVTHWRALPSPPIPQP